MKQESLQDILNSSLRSRREEAFEYALNLLSRDLSHIQNQADMRGANSANLEKLIDEISDILSQYQI